MRKRDLLGQRFGRLAVIAEGNRAADGHIRWRCLCDCGEETMVNGRCLTTGSTISCGCYRSEYVARKNFKHGAAKRSGSTTEYEIWTGMIKRCTDSNCEAYPDYGGRGIVVCRAWRESFKAFAEDMGQRPSLNHSIERKNNAGNYEPANCVWATRDVQANNKRSNVLVTYRGKTLTCKQMWEAYAVPSVTYSIFHRRIREGWDTAKALFSPRMNQL